MNNWDARKYWLESVRYYLSNAEHALLSLLYTLDPQGAELSNEFYRVMEEETRWRFLDLWGILEDAMRHYAESRIGNEEVVK